MYASLPDAAGPQVSVIVDGKPVAVPAGASVAAALLLAGAVPSRANPVTHAPRAPYCMMGVCFECLVEIDGIPERQACMIAAAEGMRVRCAPRSSPPERS
ncbi:MAG: (2Fe-2S)-binding protein [Betaproteobacteria bacterium]|nr:(2Fe-2S)-binding protein [Betaproteobacteria bacterium]